MSPRGGFDVGDSYWGEEFNTIWGGGQGDLNNQQ